MYGRAYFLCISVVGIVRKGHGHGGIRVQRQTALLSEAMAAGQRNCPENLSRQIQGECKVDQRTVSRMVWTSMGEVGVTSF